MGKLIDLTGKVFGKLLVINKAERTTKSNHAHWRCVCNCGKETIATSGHLKAGCTKSCGCAEGYIKHGMTHTRQHNIWWRMIQRCNNQSDTNYHNYGGRGIRVCEKWRDFIGFWEDMQSGYSNNLTLERINNNGDYEKNNCRWATKSEQNRNMRKNKKINFRGKTQTISEWSREFGFSWSLINTRLNKGWTPEEIFLTPRASCGRKQKSQ